MGYIAHCGTLLILCAVFALRGLAQGPALPGTIPLTMEGDLSFEMLERVDRFLLREIDRGVVGRQSLWQRDYSSAENYILSVRSNRERFARYIGLADERKPFQELELVGSLSSPTLLSETEQFRIYAVRWPVFEGVDAEGLLLEPTGKVSAQVVALPDADWTPEMAAGLTSDLLSESQFARRLAQAGCRVLVPTLIDRNNTWSGNPLIRMTNQTHREFIYRQAYFMGRHLIGYEVQKVMAAVDYLSKKNKKNGKAAALIGVAGYGEGGLLALYTAAVDQRIDAAWVSGYFQQREEVWREPVYRNVWGLLHEFGDAEISRLILPRSLIVEASQGPVVPGPPPPRNGRMDAAPGSLATPPLCSVKAEFNRAADDYPKNGG